MNIFDLFRRIEKPSEPKRPITHIIAGLGNPGVAYENTRHNAGFLAIDAVAAAAKADIRTAKFHALIAEADIGDVRALLMKPQTFMNNSGVALYEAASFYKIPPENILILHDEISFDPGILRIRRKGSAGGHNGLKSIIAALSSENFPRIKIGVGQKPFPEYDLADFVLGKFPTADLAKIREEFPKITDASSLILAGKIDEAMTKYSK